jgi:hypothetical protein
MRAKNWLDRRKKSKEKCRTDLTNPKNDSNLDCPPLFAKDAAAPAQNPPKHDTLLLIAKNEFTQS